MFVRQQSVTFTFTHNDDLYIVNYKATGKRGDYNRPVYKVVVFQNGRVIKQDHTDNIISRKMQLITSKMQENENN